jgi:hypothetical protein
LACRFISYLVTSNFSDLSGVTLIAEEVLALVEISTFGGVLGDFSCALIELCERRKIDGFLAGGRKGFISGCFLDVVETGCLLDTAETVFGVGDLIAATLGFISGYLLDTSETVFDIDVLIVVTLGSVEAYGLGNEIELEHDILEDDFPSAVVLCLVFMLMVVSASIVLSLFFFYEIFSSESIWD